MKGSDGLDGGLLSRPMEGRRQSGITKMAALHSRRTRLLVEVRRIAQDTAQGEWLNMDQLHKLFSDERLGQILHQLFDHQESGALEQEHLFAQMKEWTGVSLASIS